MRPEIELLLACARAHIDEQLAGRIRLLASRGLDWVFLLRFALAHRLMLLLYRSLSSAVPDAVPADTLDRMRRYCDAIQTKNKARFNELLELLTLFEAHNVAAIPYKGPILGLLAYGDTSLRESEDLDIVVRKEDLSKVRDLMLLRGYRFHSECDPHWAFLKEKFLVEVHWGFFPEAFDFKIEMEYFWANTRTLTVAGRNVLTLPIEHWLLLLSVHASKHCFGQFRWICDIAQLIQSNPMMNSQQIIELADRSGCRRRLNIAVALAHDVFGGPIQAQLADQCKCGWMERSFVRATWEILLSPQGEATVHIHRHLFMSLPAGTSWRHVLQANRLDRDFVPLPRPLSFLYIFIRPIRLLRDYGFPNLTYVRYLFGLFFRTSKLGITHVR